MCARKVTGDYAVGYGKPPQATRFRKGQSGNPKGRPKGSTHLYSVLEKILRQTVAIRQDGQTRRLSQLEVVLTALTRKAMQGDGKATSDLLKLMAKLTERQEALQAETDQPRYGVLVVPAPLTPEEWLERYGTQFPDQVDWEGDLARAAAAKAEQPGDDPDR